MAIVIALVIKIDIHGYCDYTDLKTDMAIIIIWASKPTFMAIVTALVIETDMAIMTVLASKPT